MDTVNKEIKVAKSSASSPLQPSHAELVTRDSGQTATHAVIFTPELLCNIISQLPLADIVTTTGVCHFWRNAIATGPQVQRALFLKPEKVQRVLVYIDEFEQISVQHKAGDAIPKEFCHTIGDMHPFLQKICGVVNGDYREVEDESSVLDFGHPNGLWRDMFISQPPCKVIKFLVKAEWEDAVVETEYRYTKKNGVSLGQLQNSILVALRKGTESRTSHDGVRKQFFLKVETQNYCEENSAFASGTTQLPARNGVALFPETMVRTHTV